MSTKGKKKTAEPPVKLTKKAAFDFLQPVRDGTRDVFGSRIKLTELVIAETGKSISRHSIVRWLRDDITKFEEPHLGIGIILLEVFKANQKEICKPWDSASRREPRGEAK